jgi:hypothetical protein
LAEPLDWIADNTIDVVVLAPVINYVDDRVAMLCDLARSSALGVLRSCRRRIR